MTDPAAPNPNGAHRADRTGTVDGRIIAAFWCAIAADDYLRAGDYALIYAAFRAGWFAHDKEIQPRP